MLVRMIGARWPTIFAGAIRAINSFWTPVTVVAVWVERGSVGLTRKTAHAVNASMKLRDRWRRSY